MAQGRFLSKTIATSRQLAALSDQAEVLFYRMIPHQDVEGRIEGDPELVKAQVVPLKRAYTVEVIAELLHELAETVDEEGVPLIRWYRVKGRAVIQFPGFKGHQSGLRPGRETPSRLPEFSQESELITRTPATMRQPSGLVAGVMSEQVRNGAGATPAEGKVSEGKVKSKKRTPSAGAGEKSFGGWPALWTRIYRVEVGHMDPGRIGKRCAEVREIYGERRALDMWAMACHDRRHFRFGKLDQEHFDPKYTGDLRSTTPEDFAQNHVFWDEYTPENYYEAWRAQHSAVEVSGAAS